MIVEEDALPRWAPGGRLTAALVAGLDFDFLLLILGLI